MVGDTVLASDPHSRPQEVVSFSKAAFLILVEEERAAMRKQLTTTATKTTQPTVLPAMIRRCNWNPTLSANSIHGWVVDMVEDTALASDPHIRPPEVDLVSQAAFLISVVVAEEEPRAAMRDAPPVIGAKASINVGFVEKDISVRQVRI